jgi:hypothetical protein
VVFEQFGVTDVAREHVKALVTRDVAHFEDAGAVAGCARQEAGAQAVSPVGCRIQPSLPAEALTRSQTAAALRRLSMTRPPFLTCRKIAPSTMPSVWPRR